MDFGIQLSQYTSVIVAAAGQQEYLNKEVEFSKNLKGATKYKAPGCTDEVMRCVKNGNILIWYQTEELFHLVQDNRGNMGPYNGFSILDYVDLNHEYSFIEIKKYDYVRISDNYVGYWAESLFEINTFWHNMKRSSKELARGGVTLIPPKSLSKFLDVIKKGESVNEVKELMKMVEEAKKENKYIIHFGI